MATIKGITIAIGGDTTALDKSLTDVNKKSRDLQTELRQVDKLLKLDPKNTELLAQKQQLLTDAVANTKEKLDRLKTAQEQVNQQFAKGEISEEQYRAFQREITKTEQDLKKFEERLKNTKPSLEDFGKKAQETGEKMSKIGTSLTKNVTAPLMATAAGLTAVGSVFDDAFDNIRIGTGATGEALETLNEDFRQVAKDVPASFGDISTAIADYNTRLGLSGEGLQNLSKQTLELARITGSDLSKTIEETSQSFQAFNVPAEQYGKALDFIFVTAQSTGIGIDRLQSNMVKFAPAMKQLGLGFEESAVLMGQLDKAGVDVEQTLSGLTKAVATMAKDGITDANEAIQILFDEIKNAPTDIQGTEAALKTFGNRAGPALATAIREGKLEYQDLLKELQGSEETILGVAGETKDWSEGLLELKNNLLLALEPLAGKLFDALNDLIPLLKSGLEFIAGLIQKFAEMPEGTQKTILVIAGLAAALGPLILGIGKVVSIVGSAISAFSAISGAITAAGGVMAVLTGPIGIAVAAIAGLIAVGVTLYKNWDTIKEKAGQLGGWVSEKWEGLKTATSEAWNNLKDTTKKAWENMQNKVEEHGGGIKGVIGAYTETYKEVWRLAFNKLNEITDGKLGEVVGKVVEFGKNSVEKITNIGKNIVEGLWNGITGMYDWIKEKVTGFAEGVAGAFKNFFGIKSPSKLMADYGKYMAEGLAEGMAKNKDKPESSAIEMSNIIDGAMKKVQESVSTTASLIQKEFQLWQLENEHLKGSSEELTMQLDTQKQQQSMLTDQITVTIEALSQISSKYGESSKQALDYKDKLLDLKIAQANLTKEVNNTIAAIEKQNSLQIEMTKYGMSVNGIIYGNDSNTRYREQRAKEMAEYADAIADISRKNNVDLGVAYDMWKNNEINQYITINSPKELSPSETAKEVKRATQKLALEW